MSDPSGPYYYVSNVYFDPQLVRRGEQVDLTYFITNTDSDTAILKGHFTIFDIAFNLIGTIPIPTTKVLPGVSVPLEALFKVPLNTFYGQCYYSWTLIAVGEDNPKEFKKIKLENSCLYEAFTVVK